MDDKDLSSCGGERRCKLGLALAGGGFRASLFHLGVLRRMAELDLLRYVEVLSTVSGGSIIGALYALLLKKHLDLKNPLKRSDYIIIIEELDKALIKGIKQNLRTRLLMNPLGLLRVLLTSDSLGKRMARIYERYIYSDIVKQLKGASNTSSLRPGEFKLKDLVITPGGRSVSEGIEEFNRRVSDENQKKGSAITKIILNATTLNSGAPFWFSPIEIGDPRLGFFRHDEIAELQMRKRLLDMNVADLEAFIKQQSSNTQPILFKGIVIRIQTSSLALWWKKRRETGKTAAVIAPWYGLPSTVPSFQDIARILANSVFGELRTMKLAAWYICKGMSRSPFVTGGLSENEHMERFWDTFSGINKSLSLDCKFAADADISYRNQLLELVLELYYLRSAEVMSKKIEDNWKELTLGEAVGASACFPPVFPPFLLMGIYDDMHVTRLGLSDGGVYDNVGLSAILNEQCTHIIVSDTSGLFNIQQQSASGRITMSGRIASILMDDVASLQRNGLRVRRRFTNAVSTLTEPSPAIDEVRRTTGLEGLAFFHIASPDIEGPGIQPPGDINLIAALRTDLDGFGDIEIAALVNRGYDMADRYIRTHFADTPYVDTDLWHPATSEPKPMNNIPVERIDKVLKAGKSRFFRSIMLLEPISLTCLTIILGAVVGAAYKWKVQISVQDAASWVKNCTIAMIEKMAPFLGKGWVEYKVVLGPALLMGISLLLVIIAAKPIADKFKLQYRRQFRVLYTVGKWMRTLAPKWLSLVGGSFIIAIVVSGMAFLGHWCFYKPFERITRIRSGVRKTYND